MLIRALRQKSGIFTSATGVNTTMLIDRKEKYVQFVFCMHYSVLSCFIALLRTAEGPRSKGLLLHTLSSLKETGQLNFCLSLTRRQLSHEIQNANSVGCLSRS